MNYIKLIKFVMTYLTDPNLMRARTPEFTTKAHNRTSILGRN